MRFLKKEFTISLMKLLLLNICLECDVDAELNHVEAQAILNKQDELVGYVGALRSSKNDFRTGL